MSISISGLLSTASLSGANASSNVAAQPAQPTASNTADTVTLTEAQQVYQLYNQGQQVSQIASTLSITVDAVNNYLGISSSAS